MAQSAGLPSVVIVGRPNVGKSTLFNAILGQRKSIVGDEPGITRDRIIGEATHHHRRFTLIDTGGIVPQDDNFIPAQILKQARVALEDASHIVFVIDGRTEITGPDRDLAQILRRLGKPLTLAVNKIDVPKRETLLAGFHSFGFDRVMPISAEHRLGILELLDAVTEGFPEDTPEPVDEFAEPAEAPEEKPRPIRISIIGRPNVGKSTLLNALTGVERAIVSPIAGTTRDSVDESITVNGREYVFVDTAGIRRKGKTHEMAEKLSVVMARRHIRTSHIALLVIDASEGPVASDATIGGYAHEEGRATIICVNKWDLVHESRRAEFEEAVRDQFKFLDYAPIVYLSAKDRKGIPGLLRQITRCYEAFDKRVTTGELNRFLDELKLERDRKIYFITQPSVRPPTFVLFMDRAEPLYFSTERQVVNRLRKKFGFEGTPLLIKVRARRKSSAR